jgi:AraC family transcriptional regulator, transcriptional activator of pobA
MSRAGNVHPPLPIAPAGEFPIQIEILKPHAPFPRGPAFCASRAELRLILVSAGEGEVLADGQLRSIAAPSLILLPAHVGDADVRFRTDARGYVVSLTEGVLKSLSAREPSLAGLFDQPHCLRLAADDMHGQYLEAGISGLVRELRHGGTAKMSAAEAHLQLVLTQALRVVVTALGDVGSNGNTAERVAVLIRQFRRLALTHFRHNWQLVDYATRLKVSSAHLRAACVKVTGMPPVQLINDYAMREAQRLLALSNVPVSSIARDLGFDDPAYFSRMFRAKCGTTASQYRMASRMKGGSQVP